MTRDEALDVLRVMTAAWPNATLTDDLVETWITYLAAVGPGEAAAVAGELVLAEEWMPTVARFRQSVTARRRQETERSKFSGASLPSGEQLTHPDDAKKRIEEMRALLREA